MKLIVASTTGLVGTEIIALARKPVQVEKGINSSKLKSMVISDYAEYTGDVKAELAGAAACIRTVAVTPFRTNSFDFAEVKRVCQDCTLAGFKTMYEAGPARPFRFLYFSVKGTPLDSTNKPALMGDHRIMRPRQCKTENMVRQFTFEYEGVEVAVVNRHSGSKVALVETVQLGLRRFMSSIALSFSVLIFSSLALFFIR